MDSNGKRFKGLNIMQGTLVSIRVRRQKIENFYKYMEYKTI